MKSPCRDCEYGMPVLNKNNVPYRYNCHSTMPCEKRNAYNIFKTGRSKYIRGKRITSLDDIENHDLLYMQFGVKTRSFVCSMPFNTVKTYLNRGIYIAEKKVDI